MTCWYCPHPKAEATADDGLCDGCREEHEYVAGLTRWFESKRPTVQMEMFGEERNG